MKSETHVNCFSRYMMVGVPIFIIGHIQFRILYNLLNRAPLQAGTAWALHFIVGTWWTHALHRTYTFRNEPQLGYWTSLVRTYGAYSLVWVLST